MSGQIRPRAAASPPRGRGKFARTVQFCLIFMSKNIMLKNIMLETLNPHKFCFIYEVNNVNQKQGFGTISATKW